MNVTTAAQNINKIDNLATDIGFSLNKCDASDPISLTSLIGALDGKSQTPNFIVYNTSLHYEGALEELNTEEVRKSFMTIDMVGFWWRRQPLNEWLLQ
ncbi:MAG: hypothetical protein CBB68_10015 [Rhodospirillaceae bacterium TMED8]|nr:hypothetical protein [Magnetovibrio sp.]OUT50190.1 MAG: hypothetical protein CBB68_10015 [Rhodospirillaceae bacterium TMED8]|tara:strand:+ start:1252 stop:1545 length:294 start_codon:yes stop_codon:yes gene_type:complete